jgi:hypothetical protein
MKKPPTPNWLPLISQKQDVKKSPEKVNHDLPELKPNCFQIQLMANNRGSKMSVHAKEIQKLFSNQ